jgi:PhoH-like ATPase
MANKKNYINDTNVILHDYSFYENFEEENDIYLPFVVLEE